MTHQGAQEVPRFSVHHELRSYFFDILAL